MQIKHSSDKCLFCTHGIVYTIILEPCASQSCIATAYVEQLSTRVYIDGRAALYIWACTGVYLVAKSLRWLRPMCETGRVSHGGRVSRVSSGGSVSHTSLGVSLVHCTPRPKPPLDPVTCIAHAGLLGELHTHIHTHTHTHAYTYKCNN